MFILYWFDLCLGPGQSKIVSQYAVPILCGDVWRGFHLLSDIIGPESEREVDLDLLRTVVVRYTQWLSSWPRTMHWD